ncbi:cysteine ase [Lecanosticta acicola]|uniref:ubiquitinyl hydrolase 1 n=1 Tax=Lecanosticta acicola TaxID=111012 RepID=A0AAI9EFA8_9PEZI|nr:cysteine ase [Lecanosticta acicola]
MDHSIQFESVPRPSITSTLAYGTLTLYALYFLLKHFDVAVLAPQELLWNAIVYIIPTTLLLDRARRHELEANDMLSQTHAAKSDALRRVLGIGGNAIMQRFPNAGEAVGMGSIMRRTSMSIAGAKAVTSEVPAGLGNWDNSCYQNSVLQALSSLGSLRSWLQVSEPPNGDGESLTNTALQEMIGKLRDPTNNGRHIWTPAKLKNMSSWQQQDAQEYFSKVMEELDKEAARTVAASETKPGLEVVLDDRNQKTANNREEESEKKGPMAPTRRNPLEGFVAQRVACTRCSFSEGYSMIPFNCLTVPLGSRFEYDLDECLDEYTKSEDIEGVECRSCTLLHQEERLQQLQLPPELRAQVAERLLAIQRALANDDYSDRALKQDCQINPKAFVSSTKSREAVIGRAPQSLAIHVNRSVFDEVTGMQRKNYARVSYPMSLDLGRWMLGFDSSAAQYRLSAVVTHYGRHENGHYICYRKHPRNVVPREGEQGPGTASPEDREQERWWRLSDEEVYQVTEEDVLGQGGVFMLFYERLEQTTDSSVSKDAADAAAIPLPPDEDADWDMMTVEQTSTATPSLITSAPESVISEDTDVELEVEQSTLPDPASKAPPQAPLLKTASPTYTSPVQKDMQHDFGMNRSLMSV